MADQNNSNIDDQTLDSLYMKLIDQVVTDNPVTTTPNIDAITLTFGSHREYAQTIPADETCDMNAQLEDISKKYATIIGSAILDGKDISPENAKDILRDISNKIINNCLSHDKAQPSNFSANSPQNDMLRYDVPNSTEQPKTMIF